MSTLASNLALIVTWVLGALGITVDDSLSSTIKTAIVAAIALVTSVHVLIGHLDRRSKNDNAAKIATAQATARGTFTAEIEHAKGELLAFANDAAQHHVNIGILKHVADEHTGTVTPATAATAPPGAVVTAEPPATSTGTQTTVATAPTSPQPVPQPPPATVAGVQAAPPLAAP